MPDSEKSDTPGAPAGPDRQLSSLARLAIVVGVPFATAFLRVPLWVTVVLLFGLAGALFVVPHLPRKTQPDPKQAWSRLMACFIKLQAIHGELQASPANEATLKQFSLYEQRCLSLLASRADSGWGADTEYAAKIGSEIAAMSAAVHASRVNQAPTPEQPGTPPTEAGGKASESRRPGTAAKADGLAESIRPEVVTSGGLLDLILANEGKAARSGSTMSSPRPEAPPPAVEQGQTLAGADAAGQPASDPLASIEEEARTPAMEPALVGARQDAAAQAENAAPASRVEEPAQTLEQFLASVGVTADREPESSATVARAEATIREEKQAVQIASAGTIGQTGNAAPSTGFNVPITAEKQGLTLASAAAAVQVETSPLLTVGPEVKTPAKRQDPAPAKDGEDVRPAGSAAPARPDVMDLAARRLAPYVWVPGGVEDAAAFYVSIFKNSRVTGMRRYPEGWHTQAWSVMSATVCLDGQDLILLNGGSVYKLPATFSLLVRCADQAEVDHYWEKLLADGGEANTCGWVKDRFGVSWQVIPNALLELLNDPNPQRTAHATEAMLKMKKIDIAMLREAVDGAEATVSLPHTAPPTLVA